MNPTINNLWVRRSKILKWTLAFLTSWTTYVFFNLIGNARHSIGSAFGAVGDLLLWAVPTAFFMMLVIHLVTLETTPDTETGDRLCANMLRIAWLSMNVFLLIGYLSQAI